MALLYVPFQFPAAGNASAPHVQANFDALISYLITVNIGALTASRAVVTDASGNLASSASTATEVGYLSGVTSAIQTQLNAKASTALSNLASVAINTSLISDTNNTDDLGSSTVGWKDLYLEGNIKDGAVTVVTPLATGCKILGTNTNDNAAAGFYGEYVSATATSTSFPASTQYGDGASISLTAGDWDISAVLDATINGGTWAEVGLGISTTTGNDATGLTTGNNRVLATHASSSTTPTQLTLTIPAFRVTLTATTTHYMKVVSTYAAGNPQYVGRISARRIR